MEYERQGYKSKQENEQQAGGTQASGLGGMQLQRWRRCAVTWVKPTFCHESSNSAKLGHTDADELSVKPGNRDKNDQGWLVFEYQSTMVYILHGDYME